MAEPGRDDVGERIADGYRRVRQDEPDEWGDLTAMADVAARELCQRLDAEEAAAGFDGW